MLEAAYRALKLQPDLEEVVPMALALLEISKQYGQFRRPPTGHELDDLNLTSIGLLLEGQGRAEAQKVKMYRELSRTHHDPRPTQEYINTRGVYTRIAANLLAQLPAISAKANFVAILPWHPDSSRIPLMNPNIPEIIVAEIDLSAPLGNCRYPMRFVPFAPSSESLPSTITEWRSDISAVTPLVYAPSFQVIPNE